jgi:hypothetical protein
MGKLRILVGEAYCLPKTTQTIRKKLILSRLVIPAKPEHPAFLTQAGTWISRWLNS